MFYRIIMTTGAELEVIAHITASYEQQRSMCTQTIHQKTPQTLIL